MILIIVPLTSLLLLAGVFPTAGVATVPHLLRLVLTTEPVFVPRLEQSEYFNIKILPSSYLVEILRLYYNLSPLADFRLPVTLFCFKLC